MKLIKKISLVLVVVIYFLVCVLGNVANGEVIIPDYAAGWTHPLRISTYPEITGGKAFGASRDNGKRTHAGIDFVTSAGTPVYAMTSGRVLAIYPFYEGTDAIEVLNNDGTTIRYGEVKALSNISAGSIISRGEQIAKIIKNTTKEKSSMLHLEIYRGTYSGALTQNNSKYDYVPKAVYKRRADLVDPTFAQYLPFELNEVGSAVKSISVKVPGTLMYIGQTMQASVSFIPVTPENKNIIWESENTDIASVDGQGIIKANGQGETSIIAKPDYDTTIESTILLSVKELSISIVAPTPKQAKAYMARKKKMQMYKRCSVPDASVAVKWHSDNKDIVSVNQAGVLTSKSVGETTVSVRLANGQSDMIKIVVLPNEKVAGKVTISGLKELEAGKSTVYTAKTDKKKATDTLKWSTSDKSIATVKKDGRVKALAPGKVTIKVKTSGGKVDKFNLVVK